MTTVLGSGATRVENPLIRKLSSFTDLGSDARAALDALSDKPQLHKAGWNLIKEGDRPEKVFLLLDGWAYRYKIMPDGGRQILAYLIPGDLCDPHVFILSEMDHSIGLLSDARVATIPKADILSLTEQYPAIARGLWWSTLVDEAVLREWLVNVAHRDAFERLAHLFCELWVRMRQVGLTRDGAFNLPLTQEQLGDTVGLTPVHVNRTLQRMRADEFVTFRGRQLTILDAERMQQIAGFDPKYLHLTRRT